MKLSALKQKASRTKQQDVTKYKIQRNLVVKLNRETKLHYFINLETQKIRNLFGINVDLIFLTNMYTVILRSFFLKKRKLQQIQIKLKKKPC